MALSDILKHIGKLRLGELAYLEQLMTGEFANEVANWFASNQSSSLISAQVTLAHIDKSPYVRPMNASYKLEFGDILIYVNRISQHKGTREGRAYVFQVKKYYPGSGVSTARQYALYKSWSPFTIDSPAYIAVDCPPTLDLNVRNAYSNVAQSGFWYMNAPRNLRVSPQFSHQDCGISSQLMNIDVFLKDIADRRAGRVVNSPADDDWSAIVHAILKYKKDLKVGRLITSEEHEDRSNKSRGALQRIIERAMRQSKSVKSYFRAFFGFKTNRMYIIQINLFSHYD